MRYAGIGAAGLMIPTLLAACGSDDPSVAASTPTGQGPAAVPKFTGQIDYYGFEGEDFKGVKEFDAFLKKNSATIKSTYYSSPDDGIGRYRSGQGKGLDVVLASSPFMPHYTEAGGILQPLDPTKIPNLNLLLPEFATKDGPWYVDGKLMTVPFSFSGFAPVWNGAGVKKPLTSWSEMADPEYKNRLVLFGDPLSSVMLITEILKLGTPGKMPKAALPKAAEYLKKMVNNARTIAASPGDVSTALQSGDADVAFGGFPVMALLAQEAGAKQATFTMTPTDGNLLSVEAWGIGAQADNADGAYAFLNEALEPEINAAMNNLIVGASTVKGGAQFVDPSVTKAFPVTLAGKYPYALPPPLESDEWVTQPEWVEQWTAITGA
jgi:spermidine/putrescine transport system substrate-binding protein